MNVDRRVFAGAAAVAAAILAVSPAKAARNRVSVVDVGGVPRWKDGCLDIPRTRRP